MLSGFSLRTRFITLMAVTTFMVTSTHAFRSITEYQDALAMVMQSFLSPANQIQADSINSTLVAEDVVMRGVSDDTSLEGDNQLTYSMSNLTQSM